MSNHEHTTSTSSQDPSSKETKSGRSSVIITALVMILALCIVAAMLLRNRQMNEELTGLKENLTQSQTSWKDIASEKETLQDELAVVEDSIREARLTYEESTEKIEDLTGQIEELTVQNGSLESQLIVADETEIVYTRKTAEIEEAVSHVQAASEALSEELASGSEYTGSLWAAMIDARNTLLETLKTEKQGLEAALSQAQAKLAALPDTGMEAKADAVRAQIQDLETQLADVRREILMYGTQSDLD